MRYRLIDGALLARLMRCPDQDGERHTVRTLAVASGVSKSKLGYMIHGRQMKVTGQQAARIAEAVGVPQTALFHPLLSAFADTDGGSK